MSPLATSCFPAPLQYNVVKARLERKAKDLNDRIWMNARVEELDDKKALLLVTSGRKGERIVLEHVEYT